MSWWNLSIQKGKWALEDNHSPEAWLTHTAEVFLDKNISDAEVAIMCAQMAPYLPIFSAAAYPCVEIIRRMRKIKKRKHRWTWWSRELFLWVHGAPENIDESIMIWYSAIQKGLFMLKKEVSNIKRTIWVHGYDSILV